MLVRSLASPRGLRIRHCRKLWCTDVAKIPHCCGYSCGVGQQLGPLAWESPYAMGEALKKAKKKKELRLECDSDGVQIIGLIPVWLHTVDSTG